MADRTPDIVGDAVRGVADGPRKYVEEKRAQAGKAIDSAKKTVRDTVNRYSDRAKKAMSSGRSRSR